MDLAQLLTELVPLCQHPLEGDNWDQILALLDREVELCEFEVARFLAASSLKGILEPKLTSRDPRERLRAVRAVRLIYPRSEAAKVLRGMVKDPDPFTRAHARYAVRALGLDDVALPDTRVRRQPWQAAVGALGMGGWNPTGWAFGTKLPRPPARASLQARFGVPPLGRADDVAALVGAGSADELRRFLRPGVGTGAPYVEFEIAKATGGTRIITTPRPALKRIQRVILDQILAKLPLHPACHGFVPGRSTVTNAAPHQGAAVVIKTDLRDFFPSVHYRRVVGVFQHYGYGYEVASLLAGLTTHRPVMLDNTVAWPGVLPQGAPTSPALANLVCRRLDARLSGLAARVGATYTRYADDLTFSFATAPACELGRFLWWVDQICQQEGFVENTRKRRILRQSAQQRITGIVVNQNLSVPRHARRQFRAILANCRAHGVASQARGRADFVDYLRGFAAYVQMVQPELGKKLVAEVEEILAADRAHGPHAPQEPGPRE